MEMKLLDPTASENVLSVHKKEKKQGRNKYADKSREKEIRSANLNSGLSSMARRIVTSPKDQSSLQSSHIEKQLSVELPSL